MTSAQKKKKTTSWGVVILILILFWPVGLWLLFRKITADKQSALKNSKALIFFGWVLFGMGIFYCINLIFGGMTIEGDSLASSIIIAVTFFCGGGLAIVYAGKKMKRNATKYKKYITIVVNQSITNIENIANAIPTSYDKAVIDLQSMIDIGYFENAYIDITKRKLVMSQCQPTFATTAQTSTTQEPTQTVVSATPVTKVVRCKNCGANNTITLGVTYECEFCGSSLS